MARDISGDTIYANKINLKGFIIEASGNGLYVTTPDGVRAKVELIDFRETPIPETAPLRLPQSSSSSTGQG